MNKENTMERNESNNWGDKMIYEDGLRPRCPKCGLKCDDDGDRYYTDLCWTCGWQTHQHRANQNMNCIRRQMRVLERGVDIYREALNDKDADWKYVANQMEVAIELVKVDLAAREAYLS